jgi:Protein of unknown function (DUF4236)/DnaJ domain
MGWYIRKSVSFGPLRFNLSKSGVGVSVGVKGARISTGPKGTYIHMGRHGLYYRERLDGPAVQPKSSHYQPIPSVLKPEALKIPPTDAGVFVDSSSQRALEQLNGRISQAAVAPFVFVGTILLGTLAYAVSAWLCLALLTVGTVLTILVHNGDVEKRTSTLSYHLMDDAAERFQKVQEALSELSKAHRVWQVGANEQTAYWKYHGGASSLVSRSIVRVAKAKPPFISTNLEIWCIDLGTMKVYFFPDRLLIWGSSRYGAASYESITVRSEPQRFIEGESVPGDADIVDCTWQYVNKNGGPDRRFASNKRIPIVLYSRLTLSSSSGLSIFLQVSNQRAATQFVAHFSHRKEEPSVSSQPGYGAPNVVASVTTTLRKSFPTVAFRVYVDSTGTVHVDWVGPPQSEVVRVALKNAIIRHEIPNVYFDFGHVDTSRGPDAETGKRGSSSAATPVGKNHKSSFEVLGVREGATRDEITAAYRHLATMYHPDKVAGLAPEYKEIAERRMKEINGAYEELKGRWG